MKNLPRISNAWALVVSSKSVFCYSIFNSLLVEILRQLNHWLKTQRAVRLHFFLAQLQRLWSICLMRKEKCNVPEKEIERKRDGDSESEKRTYGEREKEWMKMRKKRRTKWNFKGEKSVQENMQFVAEHEDEICLDGRWNIPCEPAVDVCSSLSLAKHILIKWKQGRPTKIGNNYKIQDVRRATRPCSLLFTLNIHGMQSLAGNKCANCLATCARHDSHRERKRDENHFIANWCVPRTKIYVARKWQHSWLT